MRGQQGYAREASWDGEAEGRFWQVARRKACATRHVPDEERYCSVNTYSEGVRTLMALFLTRVLCGAEALTEKRTHTVRLNSNFVGDLPCIRQDMDGERSPLGH